MEKKNNQKILIVAYHFPPDKGVGAIRPAKFAKYLNQFGWQPHVLTIKEKYIPLKEYERLKEVQHIRIVRTSVWPTFIQILLIIRNRISIFLKIKKNDVSTPEIPNMATAKNSRSTELFSSIKKNIRLLFEFPDNMNGWIIPAVWKGYWLIKKEGIKVVMATSPPRSTVLVALILSKLTRIKLLTDLRDPWYLMESLVDDYILFSGEIDLWFEKKVMANSNKVIITNDHYKRFLETRYSCMPKDRFSTLHNGYDQDDFIGLENVKPNEKFTLSYLGTFYFHRTPKEFLHALSELLQNNIISRGDLEVNFFGHVKFADGDLVEDLVKFYGLVGNVNIHDTLSYYESLLQMKKSHVLLLFAPERQYYSIPGKTFEYFGAEKNILCFGNKGATADLISQTGTGIVVDPDNINEIKNAIKELYFRWKSGKIPDFRLNKRIFERKSLTEQLTRILVNL